MNKAPVYCISKDCPLKCKKRYDAATCGVRFVNVADYAGTCRRYIRRLLEDIEREVTDISAHRNGLSEAKATDGFSPQIMMR